MNNTLYQLTAQYQQILNQLESMELDQETVKDTMDALAAPIEEKVENIIKYMKSLEALADAKKLEAKRLSDSASSDLKKVEFFKNYLNDHLTVAGIKTLQAGVFQVGFRKGTEVVQIDESKIPLYTEAPSLYIPIEPKFLGKSDLKKMLKDGSIIPGVSLVRNADSLVIK